MDGMAIVCVRHTGTNSFFPIARLLTSGIRGNLGSKPAWTACSQSPAMRGSGPNYDKLFPPIAYLLTPRGPACHAASGCGISPVTIWRCRNHLYVRQINFADRTSSNCPRIRRDGSLFIEPRNNLAPQTRIRALDNLGQSHLF